ncbi:MAG TPA: response regulator [Leptolyngbyaceae cyanobacterium M65_K2018_010]|nr:response regulator [Leptolyngbyaceae cyanobacterium M65_K2018_010]
MPTSKKRVLIVDDEPSHRLLHRMYFSAVWSVDVDLAEASNGQESVLIAEQWQPHLILMDLWMPQMDGYEAIRAIRAGAEAKPGGGVETLSPQIIVISAATSELSRSLAFEAGCDAFVCKPYEMKQLYELVKQHLATIDRAIQVTSNMLLTA